MKTEPSTITLKHYSLTTSKTATFKMKNPMETTPRTRKTREQSMNDRVLFIEDVKRLVCSGSKTMNQIRLFHAVSAEVPTVMLKQGVILKGENSNEYKWNSQLTAREIAEALFPAKPKKQKSKTIEKKSDVINEIRAITMQNNEMLRKICVSLGLDIQNCEHLTASMEA